MYIADCEKNLLETEWREKFGVFQEIGTILWKIN